MDSGGMTENVQTQHMLRRWTEAGMYGPTVSTEVDHVKKEYGSSARRWDKDIDLQGYIGEQIIHGLLTWHVPRTCVSGQPVLDAGAATGRLSRVIKRHGAHVTALDLAEDMLSVAKAEDRADAYVTGDLNQRLVFDDQSFAGVVCTAVLAYVAEPKVVDEFLRVLRPGGFLICAYPANVTRFDDKMHQLCRDGAMTKVEHPYDRMSWYMALPEYMRNDGKKYTTRVFIKA